MIEILYQTLTKIGYTHPLHPTLTHVPIGMVMGAFFFALVVLIFGKQNLAQTARHCTVLALLFVVPTALLGIMDWQHFYGGTLLFPIVMKLILAGVLIIVLVLVAVKVRTFSKGLMGLYTLGLLTVIGLGFFGGELVYGTKTPTAEVAEGAAAEGQAIFQQNCSACHFTDSTATKVGPGLKGIFKGDKFPVSGRPVTEENFKKQLAAPMGQMPPFGHLSEDQITALIAYLNTL